LSLSLFTQSLWVGLSIAAPVGPIGLLVIQRTLAQGRAVGLATGLGAAGADAVYGAVGAFGAAVVVAALQSARVPLALGGGAVLLWLAWRTWRSAADLSTAAATPARDARTLAAAFAGTFALTLTNPATVLSFVAIFGTLLAAGGAAAAASAAPWTMVAGVLVGSALWWLALCAAVGALRTRFGATQRRAIGRVSALALAAFALWQWARLGTARGA
jgi:threonine/homoserine/homoserine lactone efflux protein